VNPNSNTNAAVRIGTFAIDDWTVTFGAHQNITQQHSLGDDINF